ncbi:MAG: hypothetical protein MZV70_66940, partial [Desulfobacterales bacterium]|nr:hypothetical protein [Desulfobacterales bacterium]
MGKLDGQMLTLEGMLAAPNGSTMIREKIGGATRRSGRTGQEAGGNHSGQRRQKTYGFDVL